MTTEITAIEGRSLNRHGCELYFMRHAQSMENIGKNIVDSPLSEAGVEQARHVEGQFDLVICSPLRRTLETLHHSNLTYFKLEIDSDVRERIEYETSSLLLEEFKVESQGEFDIRCTRFTTTLERHCSELAKFKDGGRILIIGHAYWFNSWYRRGCYPSPGNATLIKMV